LIVPFNFVSCGRIENEGTTSRHKAGEIRQCRKGKARPISVLTALRVIRHNGFTVETVPDADICSATDTIAVFDNTETRSYDAVLRTEGHIRCGLRKRPIYHDGGKIIEEPDYANWKGLRYKNLECSLEKTGAGASINGRERFRAIFDQLKQR
jgi:hypothetical protein